MSVQPTHTPPPKNTYVFPHFFPQLWKAEWRKSFNLLQTITLQSFLSVAKTIEFLRLEALLEREAIYRGPTSNGGDYFHKQ